MKDMTCVKQSTITESPLPQKCTVLSDIVPLLIYKRSHMLELYTVDLYRQNTHDTHFSMIILYPL